MNQRKKEDLAAIQHLFGLATPEQAESFDAFMKTMFPPREDSLEDRVRALEAENADLEKHCEWLEGNLDLKNTVIADLKNQLRDALERC